MAKLYDEILSRSNGPYFRLLHLSPSASQTSTIQCQLNTSTLSEKIEYEALSYCWGDAANMRAIDCNGMKFMVTENLEAALLKLRLPDKPRVLWVDAVCINQNDLVERAQQVHYMQPIFHQASRVIVWLGPEYDGSELAFSACERMAKAWVKLRNDTIVGRWKDVLEEIREDWVKAWMLQSCSRLVELWGDEVAGDVESVLKVETGRPHEPLEATVVTFVHDVSREDGTKTSVEVAELRGDEIPAVMNLISRPWWTRSWIVQEVCLAREIFLACGDSVLTWVVLSVAVLVAYEGVLHDNPFGVLGKNYAMSLIRSMGKRKNSSKQLDFLDVLREYRSQNATDPRDKIYAFLGLLPSASPTHLHIKPDYQIDETECFVQAALSCVKLRENLDVLAIERYPGSGLASSLPSWVPDWSFLDPATVELPFQVPETGASGFRSFNASGSSQTCSISTDPENARVLLVKGFVCDQLAKVEEPLPASGDMEAIFTAFQASFGSHSLRAGKRFVSSQGHYSRVCIQWERLASTTSYPTGEDPLKVFCATFCAGHTSEATFRDFMNWRAELKWPKRISKLGKLGSKWLNGGWVHLTYNVFEAFGGNSDRLDDGSSPSELDSVDHFAVSRCLARTSNGYLALVPKHAQRGDCIALCRGSKFPLIIRPLASGESELVGCAYVHGLMNGEAWKDERCQSIKIA